MAPPWIQSHPRCLSFWPRPSKSGQIYSRGQSSAKRAARLVTPEANKKEGSTPILDSGRRAGRRGGGRSRGLSDNMDQDGGRKEYAEVRVTWKHTGEAVEEVGGAKGSCISTGQKENQQEPLMFPIEPAGSSVVLHLNEGSRPSPRTQKCRTKRCRNPSYVPSVGEKDVFFLCSQIHLSQKSHACRQVRSLWHTCSRSALSGSRRGGKRSPSFGVFFTLVSTDAEVKSGYNRRNDQNQFSDTVRLHGKQLSVIR